ncbi:hypothetical protein L596_018158 [Steinernema carpocapsae]|uniref:Uncharacterized protein n=1 Tax=Steinernema carpocapsae TaxID=34508 RepID=A0A4U5N4A9_STECR|nr:hypothetical protein L596_018158 [Steinernema carpocapsae]
MVLRIPSHVDERVQGQIRLKQGLIMVFAIPGIFLPMFTIYAYKIKTPRHFLWWICWLSAHNLHTVITAIVDVLKIFALNPYNPYVFFQRGREAIVNPTPYYTARELLGLTKLLTVPYSIYIVHVVFMFYCDCLLYAWHKYVSSCEDGQIGNPSESLSMPEIANSETSTATSTDRETLKSPFGPMRCLVCSRRLSSKHTVVSLRKWRSYGSSETHSHSMQVDYCMLTSDSTDYASTMS